jgi:beta-galactosidase/beta-glucuronidase
MKSLGFNTLRKHIKVEPEQFYYDCDRLGMLVMQDMVNNGHYSFIRDTALPTVGIKKLSDKRLHRDKTTRQAFYDGMESTVNQLRNHPCIVYWTVFNEGWGQFDGNAAYARLRALDSTRFIDTASGWFKVTDTDVDSEHIYFKPVKLKYTDKPMILSEFGGYSYKPEGHVFNPVNTYGYRFFKEQADFENALVKLYEDEIIPAVEKGLCGAVYTQVSDVEDETNGLLSYDRKVLKVDPARMRAIADGLSAAIQSSNA